MIKLQAIDVNLLKNYLNNKNTFNIYSFALKLFNKNVLDKQSEFKSFKDYYNIVYKFILDIKSKTIQTHFKSMYRRLVRFFDYPPINFEKTEIYSKSYEGFTPKERSRIRKYCLSAPKTIEKFTTLVYLDTGMRNFELKEFIAKFSPQADYIQITGKRNKVRKIYFTNSIRQLWKEEYRVLGFNHSRTNRRYVKCVLKELNLLIAGDGSEKSTHDFRVAYATYIYKYFTKDLITIQQLLGHNSVNQTAKYVRVTHEDMLKITKWLDDETSASIYSDVQRNRERDCEQQYEINVMSKRIKDLEEENLMLKSAINNLKNNTILSLKN